MSLHRFIATIAALLLALGATACGGSDGEDDAEPAQPPPATEEPSEPSVDDSGLADEPATSEEAGIALRGPEGWEPTDPGALPGDLLVVNPEPDDQDGQPFAANINVLSEPAQGLGLEEYFDAAVAALPQVFTDYEQVEERDVEIDGRPARIIGSTFSQGAFELQNLQLITLVDDTGYIVTASALEEDWDEYAEVFAASAQTLEVE